MTLYAGMDVSDKATHVCVVDGEGAVVRRDVVASDPDVLAKWLKRHVPGLARDVLETGPLSTFLYHGLVERDVKSVTVHYLSFPWGGLNSALSLIFHEGFHSGDRSPDHTGLWRYRREYQAYHVQANYYLIMGLRGEIGHGKTLLNAAYGSCTNVTAGMSESAAWSWHSGCSAGFREVGGGR